MSGIVHHDIGQSAILPGRLRLGGSCRSRRSPCHRLGNFNQVAGDNPPADVAPHARLPALGTPVQPVAPAQHADPSFDPRPEAEPRAEPACLLPPLCELRVGQPPLRGLPLGPRWRERDGPRFALTAPALDRSIGNFTKKRSEGAGSARMTPCRAIVGTVSSTSTARATVRLGSATASTLPWGQSAT